MVLPNDYACSAFDPALTYEMEFDLSKKAPMANLMVEYTKQMDVDDDDASTDGVQRTITRMMQNKETIRKFQGICAEELLYTMDEFFVKAEDMQMDQEQMWRDWPKCLEHAPRKLWDEIKRKHTFNPTENGLQRAIGYLLKEYAKDPRAKNTMIKNIVKQFRKPPETEVYDHYARLDRLLDYTDLLPTETPVPKLSKDDRKDYFFETHPKKWQQEFHDTKTTDFYDASMEDIMQFMKKAKRNADLEDKKKKKKDHDPSNKRSRDEGGRGGGRHSQRGGRGRGRYGSRYGGRGGERRSTEIDGNKSCPVHVGSKHTWKECSKNPESTNFKGTYMQQQQSRGGGRFPSPGGRFGGCRGHDGG